MTGNYSGNSYGTDGLDQGKFKAIMMAHHCVRLEVLGLQGCYDSGLTPFPNMADIWAVGSTANLFGTGYGRYADCDTAWASCAQAPANLPAWPAHLLADITPGATLSSNFSRIRAPWMDLWWTHFDPTLLVTGDPTAQKDEYFTRSMYWVNNNDWKFAGTPPSELHPAYAAYNAYQVMTHNIATLMTPQLASCNLYPATDFTCEAVDLRSGYYPDLVNFAEQNSVASAETSNNINYQTLYEPPTGIYRAQYQLLVTNMYRMFFWGLIGKLQDSNWMCNTALQNLRIVRAQKFFAQAETQSSHAQADAEMFATLQALMAKTTASCPALITSP